MNTNATNARPPRSSFGTLPKSIIVCFLLLAMLSGCVESPRFTNEDHMRSSYPPIADANGNVALK